MFFLSIGSSVTRNINNVVDFLP